MNIHQRLEELGMENDLAEDLTEGRFLKDLTNNYARKEEKGNDEI